MNKTEGQGRNKGIVARFFEIFEARNLSALGEVLADDVVQDMPQTRERVRGLKNLRSIYENYPLEGGYLERREVLGEEPQYVMTPTFDVIRVEGTGTNPISIVKISQADGSEWWLITFFTLREGKITKMINYWAETFPAPDWRALWVEPLEE